MHAAKIIEIAATLSRRKRYRDMSKIPIAIFILTFLVNKCFPQMVRYPFPRHSTYYKGTIKPNHLKQGIIDDQVLEFYKKWKKQYIYQATHANQAYVFFEEEGSKMQSVSEGQGYGMIIVSMMAGADPDAQKIFNNLFNYVIAHPSRSESTLMAWSQLADYKNEDTTSATDGDMDIAFALLLADKQWGSNGEFDYIDSARKMIREIMKKEINPDTYNILLSDAVESDSKDYFDMRSSDFMPLQCKSYEDATGDAKWKKVIDKNYALFSQLQKTYSQDAGLVPDFITGINRKAKPAKPRYLESRYDGCYNYNACRVPLRIAMDYLLTGDSRSYEIIHRINHWIRETSSGNPDNISAGYTLAGDDIKSRNFEALSFICPFAVAAMIDSSNQRWLNDMWEYMMGFKIEDFDYYDNSIKMLSILIISGNYWTPELNNSLYTKLQHHP
jgi:endo-1,4-beta-D-glucanase Y